MYDDIMTSSVKCLPLYYFRYILASVSGLPYLQKPRVSYDDQTKLSPVYIIFIHVDGEAKNFKKSSNAYISIVLWYGLSRVVDTVYARRFVKTRITKQSLVGLGQDVMLAVISEKRENFTVIGSHFHWFEIT